MPLSMPASPNFTMSRFGLETNTQRFESPLTKATQRVELAGNRWIATYTLPKMNRQQAAPWQAFLLRCKGGVNTFYGFDPDAKRPRGNARNFLTDAILVVGGSQVGTSINVDGCTASITDYLLPGDYFAFGSELKMVTAPVNTNGSGQATITFEPEIRTSPADNAAITIENPTCQMILMDDMQAIWNANQNGIYEPIAFSATEVF